MALYLGGNRHGRVAAPSDKCSGRNKSPRRAADEEKANHEMPTEREPRRENQHLLQACQKCITGVELRVKRLSYVQNSPPLQTNNVARMPFPLSGDQASPSMHSLPRSNDKIILWTLSSKTLSCFLFFCFYVRFVGMRKVGCVK